MCQNVRRDIALIVPSDVFKKYSWKEISVVMLKSLFSSHLWQGGGGGGGVKFLGRESSRPNPFLKIIILGNHPPAATLWRWAIIPQGNHVWQSSPGNIISHGSPCFQFFVPPDRSTSISRPPAAGAPHPTLLHPSVSNIWKVFPSTAVLLRLSENWRV